MKESKPFFASLTYLLCVFAVSFIFLVWPFPIAMEQSDPFTFFRYMFITWVLCIGAVFVWVISNGRVSKAQRLRKISSSPEFKDNSDGRSS